SVGQPDPAALGLLMRDLQPLALPDTLDPLVVDCPARPAQQFGDLAIAIATVLPSKLDNIGGETLLVLTTPRGLALCRAMLPQRPTGAALGDVQLRSPPLHAGTATRRAYEFSPGRPRRVSMSTVKSETAWRSRLFSSSRSFRRFTCSLFSPPNSWRHRNTSPRSPQSGGLRPPCSGPARPEHRPAAVSRRSLQACITSLPLLSSLMSKGVDPLWSSTMRSTLSPTSSYGALTSTLPPLAKMSVVSLPSFDFSICTMCLTLSVVRPTSE